MSKAKDLLITKDFLEIVAHGIAGGCFVNATREEIVAGAAYELTDLVLKASPSLDAGPLRAVAERISASRPRLFGASEFRARAREQRTLPLAHRGHRSRAREAAI